MQASVNRLQRKPEMGQGIFRDKTALGEWGGEDSEGFEELFVSSPFVIEAEEIMVLGSLFSARQSVDV